MNGVLGDIAPFAIAVTISPIPIVAEILLLFTRKPTANAGAFVAGFVLGVAGVLAALVVVASSVDLSGSGDGASSTASVLRIVLGVVLLAAAVRRFRNRPGPDESPPMPKWMDGMSSFAPGKSLGVGLAVGALNPKNLAMAFAAAVAIAAAGLSAADDVVAVGSYTLVAALGVMAPLVVMLLMGDRSDRILEDWKAWLVQNNAAVMAVLFLVFGVVLIGKGVGGF